MKPTAEDGGRQESRRIGGRGSLFGPQGRGRATLAIVFLTVFLDLVGFGILIPIQPFYAELLGARPTVVTLLSASFSLVQFLFAPFLGRLSDAVGRRPVMLFTIAMNAAGYTLFGLSSTLSMLFMARIICGFGSANLGTAQAIIADSTAPEDRAKGMGLIGAAFGLGFILGPAIGGFFSRFGLAVPAFVAAAFSATNWVFAYLRLPETRRARTPDTGGPKRHRDYLQGQHLGLSWAALRQALQHPNVLQLFWLYLVGTVAFSLMEQVLGLFIERVWGHDGGGSAGPLVRAASLTAYFLVLVGVTMVIIQGLLIGRLAKRFGERRLVIVGTLVVAASLALLPFVAGFKSFGLFMALGPMLAIGSGLSTPSLQSLLSQSVGSDEFGGILGLGQSLSAMGRVLGPSVAGMLFELHPGVPFWIGAILTLSCTVVALSIRPIPQSIADGM